MMARGRKGDFIFVALVVTIFIIGILIIFIKNASNNNFEENNGLGSINNISVTEYDNVDYNSESVISREDEISDIDDNSGGSDATDCLSIPLVYSIITINKIESCLEYDGSYCISQIVSCASKIENGGSATAEFNMEVIFVQDGESKDAQVGRETAKYLLGPNENYIMNKSVIINSVGESGAANQKINCFFNTIDIPKAIIC